MCILDYQHKVGLLKVWDINPNAVAIAKTVPSTLYRLLLSSSSSSSSYLLTNVSSTPFPLSPSELLNTTEDNTSVMSRPHLQFLPGALNSNVTTPAKVFLPNYKSSCCHWIGPTGSVRHSCNTSRGCCSFKEAY